jgi:two-component system, NtrC family, C4-dicarboxylate transport sensor histidine kinase DctB
MLIDMFEIIIDFVEHHEHYELDEIFLLILSLPIAFLWFAYRRLKEIIYVNNVLSKEIEKEIKKRIEHKKNFQKHVKKTLMGELINKIAHQWRQPLSYITTAASGMKVKMEYDQLSKKELVNYLDEIIKHSNNLSQTIEIFNNINEKDRKQEFVNISKIIEDSLQFIKGEFEASCIAIESNLKTFEDLRIITYPSELQQCIISVLNNSKDAIIYNKIDNGKIKINLSRIKNFIEITIQDNGGGIKQEFLEQVYEAYFTTKHEFQGTGLGLFVVKKIVTESLNGEISLKNFESGLLLTIKIPALQYLA